MEPVRTVVERDPQPAKPALPAALRELYDGDLQFPIGPARRPYVIANFVSRCESVAKKNMQPISKTDHQATHRVAAADDPELPGR